MVEIVKILKKEPQRGKPEPAPEPAAEDKGGGSQVADAMLGRSTHRPKRNTGLF